MTIGLIGTGLMGLPMAQRFMAVNVPVVVYNRTVAKLQPLQQTEAEIVHTATEVLQRCQVAIVMLSDAPAIRDVLLSEPAQSQLGDRTIIQMGTISPSQSCNLRDEITALGGDYLEAPVLGSIPEVRAGALQVMVGGTQAQFQQWLPVLQHLGVPQLIGEVGAASALKLALNQLIASLTTSFALSLGFVQQHGVSVDIFMQILRQSALHAPTFDKKLQRMVEGQYDNPNFPTKHLLKDTNLFLEEAIASHLQVDSLVGVRQLLEIACALGLAESDYSALFAAVKPNESPGN